MHDEDNYNGIYVTSKQDVDRCNAAENAKEKIEIACDCESQKGPGVQKVKCIPKGWTAYGDKWLFEDKSAESLKRVRQAVKASVDDILNQLKQDPVPAAHHFTALDHVPDVILSVKHLKAKHFKLSTCPLYLLVPAAPKESQGFFKRLKSKAWDLVKGERGRASYDLVIRKENQLYVAPDPNCHLHDAFMCPTKLGTLKDEDFVSQDAMGSVWIEGCDYEKFDFETHCHNEKNKKEWSEQLRGWVATFDGHPIGKGLSAWWNRKYLSKNRVAHDFSKTMSLPTLSDFKSKIAAKLQGMKNMVDRFTQQVKSHAHAKSQAQPGSKTLLVEKYGTQLHRRRRHHHHRMHHHHHGHRRPRMQIDG